MRKPGRPADPSGERESPWSGARAPRARDDRARAPRPNRDAERAPRARNDDERAAAYIERSARDAPATRDDASREIRLYGLNACLAAFAKRPDALRKVYLTESRMPILKHVLSWCVKHRLGYRLVEDGDLARLTGSRHHEGVCFEMLRAPSPDLAALIAAQPKAPSPSLLLWLDGVGNPHNLGALMRSAAHFGVAGILVPEESPLDVSGAAARVAEGAAEIVPLARTPSAASTRAASHAAGYTLAATVPRDGTPLYDAPLPPRLALAFGAEGEGMSGALIEAADLRLTIPGSGAIESLNVAASVAVVLG
ncbi:MAG TPA: TrmH family RNA methyltransferase, partial [Rhodanobacteraceae bacterium]|nr:TrmH family RNA methyltransferase [Rhodanobacteraceae bacterium]